MTMMGQREEEINDNDWSFSITKAMKTRRQRLASLPTKSEPAPAASATRRRRATPSAKAKPKAEPTPAAKEVVQAPAPTAATSKNDDDKIKDENEPETPSQTFAFNGKTYSTYQEMVDAKRQRNRDMLVSSGLLEAKAAVDRTAAAQKLSSSKFAASSRGLKRSKETTATGAASEPLRRRKSGRIAGTTAPRYYVETEMSGKFEIGGESGSLYVEEEEPEFYNGRVNDGSDLSISHAVELTGPKWAKEGTVEAAEHFMNETLADINDDLPIVSSGNSNKSISSESPTSVSSGRIIQSSEIITSDNLQSHLDSLSIDDTEQCVAKVTPDRIYSLACHPSPDKLIACAGDKKGFLGIWNVDQYGSTSSSENNDASKNASNDGVHLFKPHSGAISTLAWNSSGTSLLSASYDGSVRAFDAEKQVFEEVFATYSDDEKYKDKLGYGMDHGWNSWVQCMEMDRRYESGKCFFLSTSEGFLMHLDSRSRTKMTFNQQLSEKKINTVSLHPDGNVMATAGLSTIVQLWDLRKVPSRKTSQGLPKPLAWQSAGRSVNSAFFSPSGNRILTTTMSNKLQILENAHLASGLIQSKCDIKHDNQTGRWLSTLMARWHPCTFSGQEIFVVGSMKQPRTIEVFNGDGGLVREIRGDALTAVASRCCFHPNADKLIVVGSNSSGRMTIAR